MVTGSLKKLAEISVPTNPYPGLRPFNLEESHLFFGRDGQSEKLVARLAATRFLAVVGTSGSGKSSLVRAGLLPALLGGIMAGAGSSWRIAVTRPGHDPIGNLALALNEPHVFGSEITENAAIQIAITKATLRRGNRSLIAAVQQAGMPESENLLVLVDQFEEIFRFAREARSAGEEKYESFENEAAAFVKLLLEAGGQRELPIYIALTMRSDFLGDCSKFWDLPEVINEGQYLVPRLTRDQLREAITGPVLVAGGAIAPRLVNRLLNDVGDDQDQLPILQHALMRTWDIRQAGHADGEPLDTRHYEASGGMNEALSEHADEAFNELNQEQMRVAEKMFKLLTEKGEDNREIRRPVRLGEICAVAEVSEPEVTAVIEKFRQPGRSFLMPPSKTALNSDSIIDISHESLIRVWRRLRDWTNEEAASARIYKRLDDTAMLHREEKAELWRGADLNRALEWREKNNPNEVWARRYLPNFNVAMAFLEVSEKTRQQKTAKKEEQRKGQIKRARRVAVISVLGALAALALAWYTYNQRQRAVEGEKRNHQLLYATSMGLAQIAFYEGDYAKAQRLLNQFFPTPQSSQGDAGRFCWYHLWLLSHDEKTTLRRHTASVNSVALARNGGILASASDDKTIKLWDVATSQELATLNGHDKSVWSVAFSPDGGTLASGSSDHTIKLWDVASKRDLATLKGHVNAVRSVAFSPDGKTLASASEDKTVRLWDVASRRQLAILVGHTNYVYSVAFAPNGKILASGSQDDTVRLWDVVSRQELTPPLKGHEGAVRSVAFAPNGETFASVSGDKTVKIWDVRSHQVLATLGKHMDDVFSVVYSPDGRTLASASSDNTIKLWNIADQGELAILKGHADFVRSVAFGPGGKTLISASGDNTIKFWDFPNHEEKDILGCHMDHINSVAFSPDGKTLASASDDKTIKLWDMASRRELAILTGHEEPVLSVAFAPAGKILASASGDNKVKLWDAASRQVIATLEGHKDIVSSIAFSPDGKTLASASADKSVKLWDVASGRALATLTGHEDSVDSVAFASDGKILASGSRDYTIKLWDVAGRRELGTLKAHTKYVRAVVFMPDGRTLASAGSDNTIKLWDVAKRQELDSLIAHSNSVRSIAFTPDGKTLASASSDNTVKLWDVASRKELSTLKGHTDSVYSVAFSPDGNILASGSGDKDIRLYFAATDDEVAKQEHK